MGGKKNPSSSPFENIFFPGVMLKDKRSQGSVPADTWAARTSGPQFVYAACDLVRCFVLHLVVRGAVLKGQRPQRTMRPACDLPRP